MEISQIVRLLLTVGLELSVCTGDSKIDDVPVDLFDTGRIVKKIFLTGAY
jgi:hypothetical protein